MLFYEILDSERKKLLSLLKPLRERLWLAGGTGLALQLGHRSSLDLDFFTQKDFDTEKLFLELKELLEAHPLTKLQEDKNTLTLLIGKGVRLSFFRYPYPLVAPLIKDEHLTLASIEDIACMKLAAIVSRATAKDYVDLYFILQRRTLAQLLELLKQKTPELDENLVLKSLVYFDDVAAEPIQFQEGRAVSFDEVKAFLRDVTTHYIQGKI